MWGPFSVKTLGDRKAAGFPQRGGENMTEIELGSYMLFKDQMHMTPKGGVLFPSSLGRESYKVFEDDDLEGMVMERWGEINTAGAHVLKRCDGSHSVDDILKEFYADTYDESKEHVLTYLDMANKYFDVDVRDNPFKGEAHTTGSLDYFHPLRILFEVTTKCNLKCAHCNASAGPSTGHHVPTEEFLSLLERLHNHGTRDVELTGGEPLLHPDFQEIFTFCVETFEKVVVATNGLLMDEDTAEEFAKHTNVVVQISLDGSTPERHDERRGVKGAFEKAVKASQLLVSYGVPIRIMIAISRDNIDEVEDIIQFSNELDVGGINYDLVRATGRGKDLKISPHEALQWQDRMAELTLDKYKGMISFFYERERTEYSDTCGAGTTMVTMDPHGSLRPCTYLPAEYFTGGNLFESDFPSIFQSPMSEQLKTLEFPGGDTCKDCEFLNHCKGCFCNGVLMYEEIREKCMWGTSNNLEDWINFPP